MGIYAGLAPRPPIEICSPDTSCYSREEWMLYHAIREAQREVASWSTGEVYEWRPFDDSQPRAHPEWLVVNR